MTPADYAAQIVALFPRGRLWSWVGSKLLGLSQAIGDELARVDTDAEAARDEADTRTAEATLARWEADYGLASTGTTAERQARLQSAVMARRRTRPVDYQERLAPVLGLLPEQVEVLERFNWMAAVIDEPREHYRFNVYRDPDLAGTYSVADAQAIVDGYSQSHTLGRVITRKAARCDDPLSVCDATPLEGRGDWPDGVVWYRGDSGMVDDGAGRIVSIANRGSFGSEFTSSTTARRPYLWTMGGKPCARWLDDADQLSMLTDAGLTAASALHLSGTDASLSYVMRWEERGDDARVLSNRSATAGERGFLLIHNGSGVIEFRVGNGTTDTTLSAPAVSVGDVYVQVRKQGLSYQLWVNGALGASASAGSLSSTAATSLPFTFSTGSLGIPGLLPEAIVRPYALTDAEMAEERRYFERWTLRAPMYSPTVWWRGDDAEAVVTSGRYTSIPNRGSWGGSFTPDGGTGPTESTYGGLPCPVFGQLTSERLRCVRTPAAQFLALASMHLSDTSGSVAFVVDIGQAGTGEVLFSTQTSLTALGVQLQRTSANRLRLTVGNGTTTQLDLNAGAATVTTGRYAVTVRKNGTSYDVRVNGAAYTSGTSGTLSTTSAASQLLEIGPTADGFFPEFLAWNFRLSDAQAAEVESYLNRWGAVRGYVPPLTTLSPSALGVDAIWEGSGIVESGGSVTAWNSSAGNLSKSGAGTMAYTASWRNGKPAVGVVASTRLENFSAAVLTSSAWTYIWVGEVPASHPATAYGPSSANTGKPFPVIFWDAGANVDVRTSPDGATIHNTAPGLNLLSKACAIIVRVKANSQKITVVVNGSATTYTGTGAAIHAASQGWALGGWYGSGGEMTGGKIALSGIWDRELDDTETGLLAAWALAEFAL